MIKLAQLETLFLAALDTESPEQRAAFLDRACADQPAARQELEQMLAAHARLGDFLDQPAIGPLPPSNQRDLAFLQPSTKAGSLGRLAHYEILEVIGRGGCGIVLKASDEKLQRIVAIKAMAFPWIASSAARQRFIHEARAAAAINHDNVVPIYAVEEETGVPYLVMQNIAGRSLQGKIEQAGALSLDEVLRVGLQTAEGLAAAHAQGIVHRDIKPGNILLDETTGRIKITDFGLAQVVDDSMSRDGIVAGTPQYMAPEQARGELVDHRADLFSFGCVLYRLCTGKLPFKDPMPLTAGQSSAVNKPAPPRQLNPDVPPVLSDLILRLLETKPADRPQSAREVAQALAAIDLFRLSRPSRRRGPVILAVALALLLGGGGYFYAPAIYRLATNQGLLVVETDDPDVKVVVKQEEQEIVVIDAKSHQEVTLKPGAYQVQLSEPKYGLKLAAKEFTLERGEEQIVRVRWEPAPAKVPAEIQRLIGHKNHVNAAAFCLSGTHVISCGGSLFEDGKWVEGSDFSVRLWDAKTGSEVAQLLDHTAKVMCLAVSPDGKFAVSGGGGPPGEDPVIRLWDLQAAILLRRFDQRHTNRINDVAFTADGKRVVSASWDKTVRIWDVETGAETSRCDVGETVAVWGLDVSRDSKQILSGNSMGLLRLWDAESGKLIKSFPTGRNGAIGWISFSPDDRYALAAGVIGRNTIPVVWNLETGTPAHAFRGHTSWLGGMAFSPDGSRILTSSNDKTVRLWDVATEKELARFEGHENAITTVAFSSDGRFAVSASWDKTVRLWKLPE